MQVVWGYSSNVNTRTLDMHIVRLRKKLSIIQTNPYTFKQLEEWAINLWPKHNMRGDVNVC